MGLVALRGRELTFFGVRTLRNGHRPYDVVGQARRIVLSAIETYQPDVVAIEQPLNLATERSHVLNVIVQELCERVREVGLELIVLSADQVRVCVVGHARATKIQLATRLVEMGFDQLRPLIPKPPRIAVLGPSPKDKYWLHMFDALGLAVAAGAGTLGRELSAQSGARVQELDPGQRLGRT